MQIASFGGGHIGFLAVKNFAQGLKN